MKVSFTSTIFQWMLCAAVGNSHPATSSSEKLESLVTQESLLSDLKEFDRIASENGGNRAFGSPGYTASVNYVKSRLDKSDRWKSWTQDFEYPLARAKTLTLTINGKIYKDLELVYSFEETPAEGTTAPVVLFEGGGPGVCEHPDIKNVDVKDKFILFRAVNCHNPGKGSAYDRAFGKYTDALGIIFYNDNYEPLDVTKRDLHALGNVKRSDDKIPPNAVSVRRADGLELAARLNAGEELTASLVVTNYQYKNTTSQNIIAETKAGDPSKVIVLGAHLDSGEFSPGINDNARGAALLLALFDAINEGRFRPKNKIRFAWWGKGQNYRLAGSGHYVQSLTKKEVDSILLYLNFDMVSRGLFGVYDGDGSRYGYYGYPGSEIIEKLFVDYFTSKGHSVRPVHWHGDSDYVRFMMGGKFGIIKPAGGLHGGDAVPQDECWQEACDNFSNANVTHLEINTKAAAHVLYILSQTYKEIIPAIPYNQTAAMMAGY
ncbi:hypothetical protein H072_10522 [Dactylellina haptotyla CBS 200.50]|uniref:Peptide hydrolase n=1 Tax=Dactylellina haptotyla (strain CBS 200.50) TaxID=1284197 RepID=S8BA97_DACHA|nr:hypothetical protein H072_10522 [Dactylellina haptotyla CBS 200.50]